jgi:hypothetical protein
MIALREGAKVLEHEHFHSGILEVQSKKKNDQFVRTRRTQALLALPQSADFLPLILLSPSFLRHPQYFA